MKHIYISDGDKGGVGKSMLSATICEALLARGEKIALVEGDDSQPDLALRYQHDPDVLLGVMPLAMAGDANRAVSRFGEWLEANLPDQVVINLPAGAAKTLSEHADLVRQVADALGYSITAFWSLGKGDTPMAGLVKSMESGLLAHVEPARTVIVYPAFQGDPHDFVWYDHKARKTFQGREIVLPALDNRDVVKKMLLMRGRLATLASGAPPSGWMIVDKLNLARWLKSALAAIEPALNIEDD